MSILQAVIIFLAAALVIVVGMTLYVTFKYNEAAAEYDELNDHLEQAQEDLKTLLRDYIDLISENEKYIADNKELIRLNKELVQMNKELLSYEQRIDEEPEPVEPPRDTSKERLPKGHTNTFRCEDYRDLNLLGSEQLKLQQVCQTEQETGLRLYRDEMGLGYYCAALAGAYGSTIGDAWHVTLKCGGEFNIIFADYQHPDQITNADPNDFGSPDVNYDGLPTTEVIEFVADFDVMPNDLYQAGTVTYLNEFGGLYGDGGDIVDMEYLGRRWMP